MYWQLLPHASACLAAGRIYLLDVRRDRYAMVPDHLTEMVHNWLVADAKLPPPSAFNALLSDAGIVRSGDPTVTCEARHAPVPARILPIASRPARVTIGLVMEVGCLVLFTRLALRYRPLSKLIALEDRPNSRMATASIDPLIRCYDTARRFAPVERRCLVDSLALQRWLRRRGYTAQLVFGVSSAPFTAHCWLQAGKTILNDSYDRVSCFEPILVV